jgi:hypothetical protein
MSFGQFGMHRIIPPLFVHSIFSLADRRKRPSRRVDPETANLARTVFFVRRTGVDDIEVFLVRREGDAVRANHIGDDRGDRAGLASTRQTMATIDLLVGAIALVVGVDAVGGVGEPDGIGRLDHGLVARIQVLAVPLLRNDGNRAINFDAGYAARERLACDQPALIIDGVAVRIVGELAEDRDFARGLDERHHAIVRNVRPDEITVRREPGGIFRPPPNHKRSTRT